MALVPKVSVIIACRNERDFLGECLDSIVQNDYPHDQMEILVVDGLSEDGTRGIIESYRQRFPFIKCIDNPRRIASSAFNLGIEHASGDLILIMGAHSTYAPDYISRCVQASNESGADNVGGGIHVVPRTQGLLGMAIVAALSHRFGVGNSHFRCETSKRRWVDTVFGGCYRREVFAKIGKFNEKLVFNQDIDFNRRLCRSGGRILLDPTIVSEYHARSDLKAFCKHNFRNGSWVILALRFSDGIPFSWRHLIPLAFVASLLATGLVSLFLPVVWWFLLAIVAAYLSASLVASISLASKERDVRYFFIMPIIFGSLHVAYGLGSLTAIFRTVSRLPALETAHHRLGHAATTPLTDGNAPQTRCSSGEFGRTSS